jgi:hypothetical protein
MVSRWRKPGNCIFGVFRDAVPGPGRRRHHVAGTRRLLTRRLDLRHGRIIVGRVPPMRGISAPGDRPAVPAWSRGAGGAGDAARPWTVTPVSREFLSTVIPGGRVRLLARPTDWPGRSRTARGELWMGLAGSAVRMERGAADRGARAGWTGTAGDGGNSELTEGRREKTE